MGAMTASARRTQVSIEIAERIGLDEDMIEHLVYASYNRVRKGELLGSTFASRVANWYLHLERMRALWSSVALMSGLYHDQQMEKHLPLPVDSRHFNHWLRLFRETALEVCPPAAVEHFIGRAGCIADSPELGIAGKHDILFMKGQRLRRPDAEADPNGDG